MATTSRSIDTLHGVRSAGLRLTRPRRRILEVLRERGHATPDDIAGTLAGMPGPEVALSTVYRNLEALTEAGIVGRTRFDHGPAAYHLIEHADHFHLTCTACGTVLQGEPTLLDPAVRAIQQATGFRPDLRHIALRGHCQDCR